MPTKTLTATISKELVPTKPDLLSSDCLRVETVARLILIPDEQSRVNLIIHNSSSLGRIAHLKASFDSNQVNVAISDPQVYVGPAGKTAVYAVITPLTASGNALIAFDVS